MSGPDYSKTIQIGNVKRTSVEPGTTCQNWGSIDCGGPDPKVAVARFGGFALCHSCLLRAQKTARNAWRWC